MKTNIILFLLLVSLFVNPVLGLTSNGIEYNATIFPINESKLNYKVVGFFETDQQASTIEYQSLNYNLLSTIVYYGVKVRSNGSIYGINNYTVGGSAPPIIQYAHDRGVKVVLMFKDDNDTQINYTLSHPTEQAIAIQNLLAEVHNKGFDGINEDFETSVGWNKSLMTSFMQNLSTTFWNNNSNYQISVDTGGYHPTAVLRYDFSVIKDYVNNIIIMEYDWCGSWCNYASPNSPYDWHTSTTNSSVNRSLNNYLTSVDSDKLISAFPWYGIDYLTADNSSYSFVTNKPATTQIFYENLININYGNNPVMYNASWKTPWRAYLSGSQWHQVHYEDNISLMYKYDMIKNLSLAGTGIWDLNLATGIKDLWHPIEDKLLTVTHNITQYNSSMIVFEETLNNQSINSSIEMSYSFGDMNGLYNVIVHYPNQSVFLNMGIPAENGYLNYTIIGGFENGYRTQIINNIPTGTISGTVTSWLEEFLSIIGGETATETLSGVFK